MLFRSHTPSRSATTSTPGFVAPISSSLTLIAPPLLSSERLEGDVLEASHFRLQKTQVHERGAAVVLALGVLHPRTRDPEDGHSPAVHPTHLDSPKLAPADEPQGPEKEVVGLKHCVALPWTAGGEVGYVLRWIEGGPVSPLDLEPASGGLPGSNPASARLRQSVKPSKKTAKARKPVKAFLQTLTVSWL